MKAKSSVWVVGMLELAFLLPPRFTEAQQTQTYSDAWLLLLNHVELNDRWVLGNELHWRSTHFLGDKEQLLIRPFVTYRTTNVDYSAGYSYIKSYPYRSETVQLAKPEHNVWEQVTLKHQSGKFSFAHRYRLEHRFQGVLVETANEPKVESYAFSNRFRYRLTVKHPIGERYFIHAFNELWVRMNDDFGQVKFDRNWLYLGLGRKLKEGANIQLAYLHQSIQLSNGDYERHPTLQLTLQYDF